MAETSSTSSTEAAPAAAPTAGDGENFPKEFLKLPFAPERRGTQAAKGVGLKADQVLAWRDRGGEVAVVTTEPVQGEGWREQKLYAAKG